MLIIPNWPAPSRVRAVTTTRLGGHSVVPYQGLNLGMHVGDNQTVVQANRDDLQQALSLVTAPAWLNQIHSTTVIALDKPLLSVPDADGSYTCQPGLACTVMTADCLPVILCDRAGTQVAAVHAGWRGLANGIIEAALALFSVPASDILAWLGPAIGPSAFEVGSDVRDQFIAYQPEAQRAFQAYGDKWLADLYRLATQRLNASGVDQVFGGEYCTYNEPERFFSYRRDGVTGRQATLIWLTEA
ncbi:peptidoglycan editing factor PgeF [Photobacterium nomapromontoriensis]|uniref:peptidoglycan editing factor PgeF n=1 Tax=Photobacterium nomapromontoriensis TaxID=2910237 RepID=UPI003D132FDC